MVQIKVTPEMLEEVANRASNTRIALESIHNNLCNEIDHLCFQWIGASNQQFVQMFNDARPKAFTSINSIIQVEEDLKRIAEKFRNADDQDVTMEEGAMCGKPSSEEKGFDGKKLARDIAGEVSGEYDVRRAWDGIDPSTGEKLSTWDRIFAGGMAVAGLTPVGKIAKVGKGVKMTAKAAEAANTAKKATKMDRSMYINSGGRNGSISVDEWLRRDAHAVKTYEEIRNSTSDIQSIAKNTGIHERHVSRAKEHVFHKKHDLGEQGFNRFDPDYPIAQGWKRLENGNFLKEDMDLLRHEIFESRFEGIFKTDYKTAHKATVRSGRPWEIPNIDKE
ncbi:WXG100 family type VII secretion target [Bacillus anthracis]|uniref:WXG100 family type VII secretion target n=1 Tax=Bacillus anthracis TaxID=1392 RepID=UPI002DBCE4AB|nr:WXG100 family type VII secretion target [Bacillus anthracis]MEB9525920.1 WXG100 family type VII secretion target [Bacillus anthracis]MEC0042574.1 WXG100 family type VII secretion target [Bacillus anthracis]